MAEREVEVGLEEGIHARPASQFVQLAKTFSSTIEATNGERKGNAKSPLHMMAFAKKGDTILIRAEGDDAEEAVAALADFVSADGH